MTQNKQRGDNFPLFVKQNDIINNALNGTNMYSTEYFAILISLLSFLLPKIGVVISSEALTTTVQTIVTIVSALYLLYKRHKRGGVNIAGFRKA